MKKLFGILTMVIITLSFSCSSSNGVKKEGKIDVENGAEEMISIPYSVTNDITSFNLTKDEARQQARLIGIQAKSSCKNELSFTPRKVEFFQMSPDTLVMFYKFSAKNGYGAEGGLMMTRYFDKAGKEIETNGPFEN